VPLRRLEKQTVLRRNAHEDRFQELIFARFQGQPRPAP
jgi:hypothetical protein